MVTFMKKFPGGLLLIPMLVSAVINTIRPGLFADIGSVSSSMFGTAGINFYVGMISFFSAMLINPKSLAKIAKKEGVLILLKIALCVGLGFVLMKYLGQEGLWGISTLAIIIALCSTNPALFLALIGDYGEKDEEAAFGLLGLICVPAFPMLVYSLSRQTPIDWMPVISILIPIVLGIVLGNLSKEFKNLCMPGAAILTPFFGFSLGSGINLLSAFSNAPSGLLLTLLFYIGMLPVLYLVERVILRYNGIASIAITSVAGLSVAVPQMIAASDPTVAPIVESATAQIAFATVITSFITPVLVSLQAKASGITKNA